MTAALAVLCGLLALCVSVLAAAVVRSGKYGGVAQSLKVLESGQARAERLLREEMERNREETARTAYELRTELSSLVRDWADSALTGLGQLGLQQKGQLDSFAGQLAALADSNERRLAELRDTVDSRLRALQEDNAAKLEQMRQTVDERLTLTLERRLGESFRQVSERLEAVHRGLGEMQNLAAGVGDLKRVLTNVKTRGTWAEVQLGVLLEQILSPDQYQANVACKAGSQERVEYAIRLPGSGESPEPVWLPLDAKFPMEEYRRLLEAQERADPAAVEQATKRLEAQVRACARDIQSKYISPPHTTDFAIMFLATEGLYAEVLRLPGLADSLQSDLRVVVAGPTTLAALLNSLQMGFRTLAIQRRSSEVWQLLGVVKVQFCEFAGLLDKVHEKLDQASSTIDEAARRSRAIERRLRDVEALPAQVLGPAASGAEDAPPGSRG